MDKWKLVAILALISGLGGYGWYSSNASSAVPIADATPAPSAPAPPAKSPLIGQQVPGWNIPAGLWTNTNKAITPADLKGSVTLIEFFRIGCSHCQAAAPFMEQVYKKYGPLGMKMVAIQSPSVNDPEENNWVSVKEKVHEWELTYPVTFDEGGKDFSAMNIISAFFRP